MKRMIWKSLGSLLLCLSFLSVQAEEILVIHLKSGNGRQLSFALADKPVITFEGEDMLVYDTKMKTTAKLSLDDVKYYELVNTASTDIQPIQTESTKPVIAQGHVVFSQLVAGGKVHVYAIGGQLLHSYTADNSGCVDVNLTTFPKGIYVIKSPDTSIKITNR